MSARLEAFVARLLADSAFLERFLADRGAVIAAADVGPDHHAALEAIDAAGLRLAARSSSVKRTRAR